MLPANKHLNPILGIDIHMVIILGAPVPIPHPFIGLVMDPMDWIPKIGATVRVNGVPRGNAGTDGMLAMKVHIPMGGPFAMAPMIGHDAKDFFGSNRVVAEGSYFSGGGWMVMSCNDIGVPLSITPGKKFKPIPSLYLPTAATIPLPLGKPVIVGGPFVPDLMGMLMALVMSFGFGALMKVGGKALKKALTALNHKVLKKFKCTKGLSKKFCKHGFEPVNLINGSVLYDGVDFELPGPIPIRWQRSWYSDSGYEGLLGHGTHLCYDLTLLVMEADGCIGITLPDGRATAFPLLAEGDSFYSRAEKLTLTNQGHGQYALYDHNDHLTYTFDRRFDNVYKPTRLTNVGGLFIEFCYNRKHVLEKVIDTAGRQILLTHDKQDRIVRVEGNHRGSHRLFVEYGYNEAGDLNAITDANGKTTHIRYTNHLMVEKTDPNGQTFYWEYDGLVTGARCVHTWGDGGILEGFIEYHEGYNVVINSLGEKRIYYYDENDLCIQETDSSGSSRLHEYTDTPELYREIDEEGNITGFVYDDRGYLSARQAPDGAVTNLLYDERGLVKMITDPIGNATVYVYKDDQLRSVVKASRAVTSYYYDEWGRPVVIENDLGKKTLLQYDDDHNLISMSFPGGAMAQWEYDAWGHCTTVVNPQGQTQNFSYDVLGRVVRIRNYDGNKVLFRYNSYGEVLYAEDINRKLHFEYTPLGSMTMVEENGSRVYYNYDTEERMVSIVNEKREVFRYRYDHRGKIAEETGFDGRVRRYERNSAGRILRVDRPGGRYTEYEYDMAGRVTQMKYNDGSWDAYSYDAAGKLIEAVNETNTVTMKLDSGGRVVSEDQDGYQVQSRYDQLGRRTALSSSLGAAISVSRNEAGQVAQLQSTNQEGVQWEAKLSYNILGLETERLLPGGVVATFDYDKAGRPLEQGVRSGNRGMRHRIYAWNVSERLQSMVNGLTRGVTQYGYDEFANLAWARYEDNTVEYRTADKTGNLYQTKEKSDRVYGTGGQLLSADGVVFDYDEEGNRIAKRSPDGQQWRYEWKGNGQLKQVHRPDGSTVAFEYDALGRRTAKICNGKITRWVWDGNKPLHEWKYDVRERPVTVIDEWGTVTKDKAEPVALVTTWVFDEGSSKPAAKLTGDQSYSIVTDYLGTPVEMYDGQGRQTWSVDHDIYGGIRKQHQGLAAECPFRYQGQYEDEETGLYYNRFRYYSAEEGAFISQDPVRMLAGRRFYNYVADPNSWIDPLGLAPVPVQTPSQATPLQSVPSNADLQAKADAIADANPSSKGWKTTAVGYATDADGNGYLIVASSDKHLSPAQRNALDLNKGELRASGLGHAETTIIDYAKANNLTVETIAASRPICPECANALEAEGIEPASPLKKVPCGK